MAAKRKHRSMFIVLAPVWSERAVRHSEAAKLLRVKIIASIVADASN
jgi:hypothetical protein